MVVNEEFGENYLSCFRPRRPSGRGRRPAPGNRRRFRKQPPGLGGFAAPPGAPDFFYKRAEDMPGYEKFTLDEVIHPETVRAGGKKVQRHC